MTDSVGTAAQATVCDGRTPLRQRLRHRWCRLVRPAWLTTLVRTSPLSDNWGLERGTPVDRYYIDRFLEQHRNDIRGRVLELQEPRYTDRFGRGVVRSDVLDIRRDNRRATIFADLAAADDVPSDIFDCFILTQTLQYIYDLRAAVLHTHRILRPGGVLLVTVPSVSRISPRHGLETEHWRFTAASCSALFGERFGREHIAVQTAGNMRTAIAFLAGMAYEELSRHDLERQDAYFPLVVMVRAVKAQR